MLGPEALRWIQLTRPSHTCRYACVFSSTLQSGGQKASTESKYLGGSCYEWQRWRVERGRLCVFQSLTAWPRVHARLHKNQTYHCCRGRCGAHNERVQLKLLIYLDGRRMRRQTKLNVLCFNLPLLMDYVKSETVSRDARVLFSSWL